jgi:hypothetical protein
VRWDGSSWTLQTFPDPGDPATLLGVSCPFACTAVGSIFHVRTQLDATLAGGWNGTSWAIQPTPALGVDSDLSAVSCTSGIACTAVGRYRSDGANVTLAERWDGTNWTVQATRNPAGYNSSTLAGVSCTAATACTAVGQHMLANNSGSYETLAERWDGTSWAIQPTPAQPSSVFAALVAVSCTSATSCIAVGHTNTDTFYSDDHVSTLSEAWDGTKWTIQPTPAPGSSSDLNAVSCTSPTACTAVGHYNTPTGKATLAERWDGTNWTIQSTPNPPGASSALFGVSCTSTTACTAVGY